MGIIYALSCRDTFEFYIGSTIGSLEKRIRKHECKTNTCRSKQIIERGNYEFKILEENDITDQNELVKSEQLWMDEYPDCINRYRAYISEKDRREENKIRCKLWKEEHKEYNKEWSKINKEYNNERNKVWRDYTSSWGGDKRYYNNLLQISIDLFN